MCCVIRKDHPTFYPYSCNSVLGSGVNVLPGPVLRSESRRRAALRGDADDGLTMLFLVLYLCVEYIRSKF